MEKNKDLADGENFSLKTISSELTADMFDEKIYPLENPKLWRYLQNLSVLDKNSLVNRMAGSDLRILRKKTGSSELDLLLIHPAIVANLDEFISWQSKHVIRKENLDCLNVLNRFFEYLISKSSNRNAGSKERLYRGIVLNDGKELEILNEGMYAPAMRTRSQAKQAFSFLLDPNSEMFNETSPSSFTDDVISRITDEISKVFISLSTSKYPEVAESVGYHSSKNRDIDSHLYLFEVAVPRFNRYSEFELMHDLRGPQILQIGSKTFSNPGIEYFVPFMIPADAILGVKKIEKTPPYWNEIRDRS